MENTHFFISWRNTNFRLSLRSHHSGMRAERKNLKRRRGKLRRGNLEAKKEANQEKGKPFQSPSDHKNAITLRQKIKDKRSRVSTVPDFRKKRIPLARWQIPPILIKPFPRASLMTSDLHTLTNFQKELRLFFGLALNLR